VTACVMCLSVDYMHGPEPEFPAEVLVRQAEGVQSNQLDLSFPLPAPHTEMGASCNPRRLPAYMPMQSPLCFAPFPCTHACPSPLYRTTPSSCMAAAISVRSPTAASRSVLQSAPLPQTMTGEVLYCLYQLCVLLFVCVMGYSRSVC
jgi:hypothetical protein